MDKSEAFDHFIAQLPNCAISRVGTDRDDHDEIIWWSCHIEDVNTGHIGTAQFAEHLGEVDADWKER